MKFKIRKRDPRKEQYWRDVMSRQRASGLSQVAVCEREQIKLTTFQFWRRELHRRDRQVASADEATKPSSPQQVGSPERAPVPLFVPVEIAASGPASSCEIVLSDGLVIRFPPACDPGQIARMVKTLERR